MEQQPSGESVCIICHDAKPSGIRICNQFICHDCERDIVHAKVGDEQYRRYVEEMKRIWISALSL